MTSREHVITLVPVYRRSLTVQDPAAMKARRLAVKKPRLGTIGLIDGAFQVILMYGELAIAAAITDKISAHLAPLVNQRRMQMMTETAITLSKFDQAHFPFINKTNAVEVDPIA